MIRRRLGCHAGYFAPGSCGFAAVNLIWAKLRQKVTAMATLLAASGQETTLVIVGLREELPSDLSGKL